MNPLVHLRVQLTRHLQYLFIALLFASFGMAQSAQSVGPESVLSSETENSATGQGDNTREIPINFQKPRQCAGGDVTLSGKVLVTFEHTSVGVVQPSFIKLEGFRGIAKSGNRKLVAKNLRFWGPVTTGNQNGQHEGKFSFEFDVFGPGLPGGRPLHIRVRYGCGKNTGCASPNRYIFEQGKVTNMFPDETPKVECIF